tara:strand:- start:569 stop:778 length:210 start_codon:yes stop_codon:yes gene_type:complete
MSDDHYKPGDMCYFISSLNKIEMCEVIRKIVEKNNILYQVRDCSNWRYSIVDSLYCADKKIHLKGKKRK